MNKLGVKIKTIFFVISFYFLFGIVRLITVFNQIIGLRKWNRSPKKDLLYLEVLPVGGAGYEYRVKKWLEYFNKLGFIVDAKVLVKDSDFFFQIVIPERLQSFVFKTGFIRFFQLFDIRKYKTVIVRRSVVLYNDYGNHYFEKLIHSIHPNVLLDFDDDIATNTVQDRGTESLFQKIMMEDLDSFNQSLQYYDGFIAGSNYLKELVLERCLKVKEEDVCVIPTCVDYDKYPRKIIGNSLGIIKFGWIGGNQNLPLLKKIIPYLNQLSEKTAIELIVITGVDNYPFGAKFPVQFISYNINTEIENLKKIDIGLMPLDDDLVSKGKCGFKLIQYMGLGIPGIASAITVNNEIIDDNENGWLVKKERDWLEKLRYVAEKTNKLDSFGKKAYEKIVSNYSYEANIDKYVNFVFNHKQ